MWKDSPFLFVLALLVLGAGCPNTSILAVSSTTLTVNLPETNLNQTADMKLAFLGVPPEYVNQTRLSQPYLLPPIFSQFAHPYRMTWNLNYSFVFYLFPKDVSDALKNNAFYSQGNAYFNATLLDALLSQIQDLTIPKCGSIDRKYSAAVEKIASLYFNLDTIPPNIIVVSQTPLQSSVSPEDKVEVQATVIDDLSEVKRVTLNYATNNGTWDKVDMTNVEGYMWNGTIPAFPLGTNVTYTILAADKFDNSIA